MAKTTDKNTADVAENIATEIESESSTTDKNTADVAGSPYRVREGASITSARGILTNCDICPSDLHDESSFTALVEQGYIVKK